MFFVLLFFIVLIEIPPGLSDTVSFGILRILEKHFKTCEVVFVDITKENISYFSFPFEHVNSSGNFVVYSSSPKDKIVSFHRLRDVHKHQPMCGLGVIFVDNIRPNATNWLFQTVTPRYVPVIRKDVDHFIFTFKSENIAQKILYSNDFGQKIRYKMAIILQNTVQYRTASLYENNGQPLTKPFSLNSSILKVEWLFPDSTQNLFGKVIRVAKTSTNNHFEMKPLSSKGFRATRGSYKSWLELMMKRFNFTIVLSLASSSGGTGKLLPNGTWKGAVADILYGDADIATYVGHIYNRHPFVDWSTPLSYEWMLFITHKPKTFYSPSAIIQAFPEALWMGFFASALLICITLNIISKAHSVQFSYRETLKYLIATFLEQDDIYLLNKLKLSSVRQVVCSWGMLSIILSTAYKGKLVSLIAFPQKGWVPQTLDELAYSHYDVGVNVLGKGGAAYTVFSTSKHPVYQTIFKKMDVYSDAAKCLKKGLTNDIGCIMWISVAKYTLYKNFTDIYGHSPFTLAQHGYSFIEDGFVWEKRAVFRENFDRITWALLERGVIEYWVYTDYNEVKRKSLKRQSSSDDMSKGAVLYADSNDSRLEFIHLKGLLYIVLMGHLFSFIALISELFVNSKYFVKIRKRSVNWFYAS